MPKHEISKEPFGSTPEGREVERYTLVNHQGLMARVISYGAMLTELHVPDRQGHLGDVVLGFDTLDGYLTRHPYFGCTTGRVANRIAGAHFTLQGKEFSLAANLGPHHLHGGLLALDKRIWQATPQENPEGPAVKFFYRSPDGEEGYPGNLSITVTYTLTHQDALRIDYEAVTDQDTPVNLTNHSYFNLTDGGRSNILEHVLEIMADHYTPVDTESIPTGEIQEVDAIMSFETPTPVGARFKQLGGNPGGYDHNYVLRKTGPGKLDLAARVYDPQSGRLMEVSTTQPGVQLYTSNFLDGTLTGKGGVAYQSHHALCLETQHFPDALHHPQFPSIILSPGETYRHTTIHQFRCQ